MFCKNCGEQMNDNQAICLKCGVAAGKGDSYCANCGSVIASNADVCLSCGVAVKKTEELGGQDKIVVALLCFFLGSIGIHNFVMGEKKKGIMKIILAFCFGISSIFALIDLVKILIDKYEVNPEKLF